MKWKIISSTEKAHFINVGTERFWIPKAWVNKNNELSQKALEKYEQVQKEEGMVYDIIDETKKAYIIELLFTKEVGSKKLKSQFKGRRAVPKSRCKRLKNNKVEVPMWIAGSLRLDMSKDELVFDPSKDNKKFA